MLQTETFMGLELRLEVHGSWGPSLGNTLSAKVGEHCGCCSHERTVTFAGTNFTSGLRVKQKSSQLAVGTWRDPWQ